MSSNNTSKRSFPIGAAGKREVRNLLRATTDPAFTIREFQTTHSLHAMFAKAFQTFPKHEAKGEKEEEIESLDTDSVLTFLHHLGVKQYEVHKRIADALRTNLEDEIRKVKKTEPLLNLLKSCWQYSTTVPDLRPVLWAVLKQLGSDTPVQVLERLGERASDGTSLKHAEAWHPLPPLLKRLVWEADWDKYVGDREPNDPKEYLTLAQTTLFARKVKPLIEQYISQPILEESSNLPFVSSQRERRLMTTQRRALYNTKVKTTSPAKKESKQQQLEQGFRQSSKAVSELRRLLAGGDSPAYRPKLLNAILSILMAHHGVSPVFLGGASHLYCTLVADILLSGPLPKSYLPVLSLARTLDESVKLGVIPDDHLVQIQTSLRQIFPPDDDSIEGDSKPIAEASSMSVSNPTLFSSELKALVKKVVASGIKAMKEVDPRNLFLNPVTDDIAPGYTNVIKKPMCMKQMETKEYLTIEDWDHDVQLMFRNCIAYNTGNEGAWFRGEARRQNKVFKDEIYPQAKRLYDEESAKIMPPPEVQKKRKKSGVGEIEPLKPTKGTKRPKGDKDDPYAPSMRPLASMLLSDPFVIRLFLDRTLRSLRIDTLNGATLPIAHAVIPSLLQLLQLAQLSKQLCAFRGKQYIVPSVGMVYDEENPAPYQSLREYTPLLLKLFLEAELDKRTASDLQDAKHSLPRRTNVISPEAWKGARHLHVLRALVEGALVFVCQPGNAVDASLSLTFPKFSDALCQLASPNLWEEKPFFLSLIQAIVRHKGKLDKSARDAIVSSWITWLKMSLNKEEKKGPMFSAAHECLLMLLCEWVSMGNLVVSRDFLIKATQDTVESVNTSEKSEDRKFPFVWNTDRFSSIRAMYERILKTLPDNQAREWKEKVGIKDEVITTKNDQKQMPVDTGEPTKADREVSSTQEDPSTASAH